MSLLHIIEVTPGMELERAIISPDNGQCLLKSGSILSIKNIEKLKELEIEELYIKDRNTIFITPNDKMYKTLIYDFTMKLRQVAPKNPEANKNNNVVKIADFLEKIIVKIAKSDVILDFLVQLRIINKTYLYDVAIETAVLSGLVAGSLNLESEDIIAAVICGLLHDIGLAEMPFLINIDNFAPQQESLWREHPTYGYYFASQENIPKNIALGIRHHHEMFNGSGYPKGLAGEDIPMLARIVSVCAHYTNLLIKNTPPYIAVEELYGTSGIYFDPKVVDAFVNNIPIYPLGVMVRLSTKEVGIVANIRKNEGPRPIIKIFFNRVNRTITEDKIIDLGKERTIFIEEIL